MRNRQSIKKIRYFCFFFVGPGRAMLRPHSEGEVCRKRFSFVSALMGSFYLASSIKYVLRMLLRPKTEMSWRRILLPSIPFRDDKMEKLESPFPCKRALSGGLPTARHCLTDERKERKGRRDGENRGKH